MIRLLTYIITTNRIYYILYPNDVMITDINKVIEYIFSGKVLIPILLFMFTIIILEWIMPIPYFLINYFYTDRKVKENIELAKLSPFDKAKIKRFFEISINKNIKIGNIDKISNKIIKIKTIDNIAKIIMQISLLLFLLLSSMQIINVLLTAFILFIIIVIRKKIYITEVLIKEVEKHKEQ